MLTSLALAWTIVAQAPAIRIEDLRWLEGEWRTLTLVARAHDGGQRLDWSEERWSAPAGGTMVGFARSIRGTSTRSFEFMRIAREDSRLIFYGSPGGGPAVAFPLVRSAPNAAVFENPTHDYPQRISYRRDGHKLIATVSLADGSREQSWTYYANGRVVP